VRRRSKERNAKLMKLPTWRQFREEAGGYDGPPITVNAQIDRVCFSNTLVS
jgi:hypothetical protein